MALPEDRLIPVSKFPEKVRKFVSPKAPPPMKSMVARGMVPMKPLVQVCALYQIAARDGGDLAKDAGRTVKGMPPGTLRSIAREPLLPVVLDWLAGLFEDSREILQPVVLNKMVDGSTLAKIARASSDTSVLEMIANNQAKLLEAPEVIEALFLNRAMRASSVDRMLDFAARNAVALPNIPDFEQIVAAIAGDLPQSEEEARQADAKFDAAREALDELSGRSEEEVAEVADAFAEEAEQKAREPAAEPEVEAEPEKKRSSSAAGRIRELNVAQKVRLAMMGNKTERGILIRDTNKIVCRAVIRSPAVSDGEALVYAKNKALLDEVIAYIANNKKWLRHYRMKLALVLNPKTPTGDAMRFMTHLRLTDLRAVARSKGVPGPITKAAKNLIKTRLK